MAETQRPHRGVRVPFLVAGLVLTAVLGGAGSLGAAATDRIIYDDALAPGWQNWSWNGAVNLNGTTAFSGSRALIWQITGAWGGLYLHTDAAVQTGSDTALQFALRASQPGQRLVVAVYGDGGQQVGVTQQLSQVGGDPVANQWTTYSIPLTSLAAAGQRITGVVLQDATGAPQPAIIVDQIQLAGTAGGPGAPPPPSVSSCLGVPAYPEIRPQNVTANQTQGRPTDPAKFYGNPAWRRYYDRIDGACTGTTEQILEWAAKKWGFDQLGYPDLAKAMAVVETWWTQSWVGALGEVGILQVHPAYWPDWEPVVWSTAYAADYAMAVVRSHYDGASWLGSATQGNLRDAVGAWQCGCAYNGGAWYATTVFGYYDSKPWQRPGQPPDWF